MTDYLIINNLRKNELVVIESKQKLQSFVLPHPIPFPAFNVIFLRKVSMNYNIRFQNVFVMTNYEGYSESSWNLIIKCSNINKILPFFETSQVDINE